MIMGMGTLRITEAELARDIHAILAQVQRGAEVAAMESALVTENLRHFKKIPGLVVKPI